ncbi:F-box only protein 39-like [Physella acuta]|uniref:F-box only protein 39-like n=1 Tax=Physella acuta TaxID=109671 RepID=UPI0027DDAA7E|nr:F-box only protein 39-like [Physella acuta]
MAKLNETTADGSKRFKTDFPKYNDDNKSEDKYQGVQLPMEILLKIFSYLNKVELLRMGTMCRSWRDLIHNTPSLWRNIHLDLSCNRKSAHNRRTFWYAQQFGMNFWNLSVSCSHEHESDVCKFMGVDFRKLLLTMQPPSLRSIKITDLELRGALLNTVKVIREMLIQTLNRTDGLHSFKMSALFSVEEGSKVLDAVFSVSRGTLETLYIDRFFRKSLLYYHRNEHDKLTNGILSLTRLTKLGIDYLQLTDGFLTALSRSHAGQLKRLKVVARDLKEDVPRFNYYNHSNTLATDSWLPLTKSCPDLRVVFVTDDLTLADFESIMEILNPVMPIYKIKILSVFEYLDDLGFENVLNEITANFKNTLVKFEMERSNTATHIDAAFLDLVRNCQRLTYIKVSVNFSDPETERMAQELVQARRRQLETSKSQEMPNKRAKLTPADGPGSSPA